MTSTPAITIITPTHNRRPALLRAIASVRGQSFENFEHIIIDDASSDDTIQAVTAISDPRIRLLRFTQWRGANPARNEGIAHARSPIVTFLDSDDEFLPNRLARTVEHLNAHPDDHLLISSFKTRKNEHEMLVGSNPVGEIGSALLQELLMAHALYIAGSAITVRRDMLLRAGGFDPDLLRMQDRDLLLRLARHCGARTLPDIDWVKHRSADSISSPRLGYVTALGHLLSKHPDLIRHHRTLVSYLVARHILVDLCNVRIGLVSDAMRANRQAPGFKFTAGELYRGYIEGKKIRRNITDTFHKAIGNQT